MSGCTKFTINPFTGQFDAYRDEVSFSNNIVDNRTCLATASLGDLVVESGTLVGRVDVAVDNADIRPVVGVIISKSSDTDCTVLFVGSVGGYSGLTKGNKVYLSITGEFTSSVPTTGYLQCLGVASEDSVIDFNPQFQRVKRI